MPTPAELRERAGEENARARAIKAWMAVEQSAGAIGSYKSVCFEDATINAVIRGMGGWPVLLAKTGDEFDKWARQDFLKAYESLAGNIDRRNEACRPLPGLQTIEDDVAYVRVGYSVPRKLQSLASERQKTLAHESSTTTTRGERQTLPVEAVIQRALTKTASS